MTVNFEIISQEIKDWDEKRNEEVFDMVIEPDVVGSQEGVYITLKGKTSGNYLQVRIGVDKGVPTVRLWGEDGGDALLHIHRDKSDELWVTPENSLDMEKAYDPFLNGSEGFVVTAEQELTPLPPYMTDRDLMTFLEDEIPEEVLTNRQCRQLQMDILSEVVNLLDTKTTRFTIESTWTTITVQGWNKDRETFEFETKMRDL